MIPAWVLVVSIMLTIAWGVALMVMSRVLAAKSTVDSAVVTVLGEQRRNHDEIEAVKLRIAELSVENYEKLSHRFIDLATKFEELRTQVRGIDESYTSMANKLAARERVDSRARNRMAREDAAEQEAMSIQPAIPAESTNKNGSAPGWALNLGRGQ